MSKVLITENSLQNIANAIRDKNGLSDKYTPSEMAQAIEDIPTGGGTASPQYVSFYMWKGEDLDLSWLDWSNLESTAYMFYGCNNITTANWANIVSSIRITSKNTSLAYMFYNCPYLNTIDVSNWDTSNVESFNYLFRSNSSESSTSTSFTNIVGLDNFDMSSATTLTNMFTCVNLSQEQWSKIQNWSFSALTKVSSMFYYARLKNLDLSNWDLSTSPITSLDSMFRYTYGGSSSEPITLNLSGLCTSNITSLEFFMAGSGIYCAKINFSNWDTSNVTSMASMFNKGTYDGSLETLDLSSFTTPKLKNTNYMFGNCKTTTKIDMRKFNFSTVTSSTNMFGASASNGVPNNCLIIVADNTQKSWITSRFSRLTNVKTVAELGE